jgi:hypothetical protein
MFLIFIFLKDNAADIIPVLLAQVTYVTLEHKTRLTSQILESEICDSVRVA